MASKFWDKALFTPAETVKLVFYALAGAGLYFGLRSEIRDIKLESQRELDLLKLRVSYLEKRETVSVNNNPLRKANREENEIFIAGVLPAQISLPYKFRRK